VIDGVGAMLHRVGSARAAWPTAIVSTWPFEPHRVASDAPGHDAQGERPSDAACSHRQPPLTTREADEGTTQVLGVECIRVCIRHRVQKLCVRCIGTLVLRDPASLADGPGATVLTTMTSPGACHPEMRRPATSARLLTPGARRALAGSGYAAAEATARGPKMSEAAVR
jgi:hypothetical protein